VIPRSVRTPERAAAMVVDVDRFKFFNDSYSNSHGDLLLKAVAERLREFVKQGDTLARISRDEFVLLFTNLTSIDEAALVATRVLEAFNRLIVVEERELFVTVSIGISLFPEDGDGDAMLRSTDAAMHRAKEHGGACFEFYAEKSSTRARERVEMASALRARLERCSEKGSCTVFTGWDGNCPRPLGSVADSNGALVKRCGRRGPAQPHRALPVRRVATGGSTTL
jgi:diguanylate cyclase (GGDEF)-like protein